MNHAVRVHAHGGPENMVWEEVPLPTPRADEALVRHHAIGLNYIDVYFRTGLYKVPQLPVTLGMEGSGVIEAVGDDVVGLEVGDRVAYAMGLGAYAEARTIKADRLVKLPDAIDFATGAGMMLQGMTAQYLLRRTFPVKAGQTILVHAAAGGVGLILCQWARALGCTVIGTVSTPEKADLARQNGADHIVIAGKEDLPARVKEITGGAMLPVVYDSVGRDTFMDSLDCLAPFGVMVSYGNASGPVTPFDIGILAAKGSLFLTRPTLATYTARPDDLAETAADLFAAVQSGAVKIRVNQTYALKDAAEAHRALEGRKTTGSTVFIP